MVVVLHSGITVTHSFGFCACSKRGFLLAGYNIAHVSRDIQCASAVKTLSKIICARGSSTSAHVDLICACAFFGTIMPYNVS